MEQEVVNFHFLLAYLSSLGDPVFGGPCAYGGDEGLEAGGAQEHLVPLVADSLKADHFQDADAHAHDHASDDEVAAGPRWSVPQ